ncbi:carbohydrate ABC transporter permease [Pseudokineococcus lusitanus]|uniref:Carbohydrate ABC transporter membrane protein 1 (CUT1 family) n=1 Tax=Pseudokineococcus lusitanus TaxID=763993 RepID=A0A3N1G8Y7_9ACTN|nr:sugar ABC transporter permease [Pseudokineococcus lusitanus]ROP26677.1 carbohydrate ABC transporter membrane protein 1 (CUT1 family) [Pseudokineococcus lusitanus]
MAAAAAPAGGSTTRARPAPAPRRRGGRPGARAEGVAGWLFVAPVLVLLGLFLVVPIVMALWVSVSDWDGIGSPFSGDVGFVGAANYRELVAGGGLATQDFGTALRNNLWYVLLVVPLQTAVSLGLALLVGRAALRGRGFFRTAFYFPSVTSSVAITIVFLFLFSSSGVVNRLLALLRVEGPNWFADPRGVLHVVLGAVGVDAGPAVLTGNGAVGISWWDWLAGPSVAMSALVLLAVFTTSGTFMLLFLAGLQQVSGEVLEAASVDGANAWQRFRHVTLPMLRPTLFTVLTLGLIGTWQVFDQIYTGTQGGPAKTTVTPAYLSYTTSFVSQEWGRGAAIAFVLFAIIVTLTVVQRVLLTERDVPLRRRWRARGGGGVGTTGSGVPAAPGGPGAPAAVTAATTPGATSTGGTR